MEDKELEELMVQSFIQIMMDTEKTAEGKAELAQAQANDRRRRETQQLQVQFGTGDVQQTTADETTNPQPQGPNPSGVNSLVGAREQSLVEGNFQQIHPGLAVPGPSIHPPDQQLQQPQLQPLPQHLRQQQQPQIPVHHYQQPSSFPQYQYQQQQYHNQQPQQHPHQSHHQEHQLPQYQLPQQHPHQSHHQEHQLPQYQLPQQHPHQSHYQEHQLPQYQLPQQHHHQNHHQEHQLPQYHQYHQQQQQFAPHQITTSYPIQVNGTNTQHPSSNQFHNVNLDQRQHQFQQEQEKSQYSGRNLNNQGHLDATYFDNQQRYGNLDRFIRQDEIDSRDRQRKLGHDHRVHQLLQRDGQVHQSPFNDTAMTNAHSSQSAGSQQFPPTLDVYAHSGDVYANPNYVSSTAGPVGMSTAFSGNAENGNGPSIIVLDKSDDDIVDDGTPSTHDQLYAKRHYPKDVFPVNREAVERDMFKQVFNPKQGKSSKEEEPVTKTEHGMDVAGPQNIDGADSRNNNNSTSILTAQIDPKRFGYPDITNNPNLLRSDRDDQTGSEIDPSETELDTARTKDSNTDRNSLYPSSTFNETEPQNHQNQQGPQKGRHASQIPNNQLFQAPHFNNAYSPMNATHDISPLPLHHEQQQPQLLQQQQQQDIDRYTIVPSQLTVIKADEIDNYLGMSLDSYRSVDPNPFDKDGDFHSPRHRQAPGNAYHGVDSNKTFLVPTKRPPTNPASSHDQNIHTKEQTGQSHEPLPQMALKDQRGHVTSTSSINTKAPTPDFKVVGPGYKLNVTDQDRVSKRATRASILSKAEQLLYARRGQPAEKSDSSPDEGRNQNEAGYDEDDDDDIRDLGEPRHRSLRHIRHKYYDDNTSYNSSDEVLTSLRYRKSGPLSKAARRARLTSFNARLHKKQRLKASLRLTNLPPANSDDELNSSESDVMGTVRDEERYEESKLRDLSNSNRHDDLLDDPADPSALKKGRRVFFFRNGDIHFKPKQVLISSRTYQNFEKLLIDLSSIVETSTGVKYIYSWPDGREIKSITQFQNGKYYVCSSTNRLQRVDYGNSKENPWKGGKLDRKENFLFQKNGKVQSPLRKPRVLTIISNMYRDSREKLILNTNSSMNFEEILHDISNMVNIPNPPVRALFTERKPHTQVFSYSQLIRDFADHDNFLACGEEMVPLEMSTKRPLQNGYSMSSEGSKKGSKRTPRYVPPPLEDGYGSPTRSYVVTAYQNHASGVARLPKADVRVRRRKTDSVRVDINGKTREFFPPTLMDENEDGAKPDKKLRLEWVYGFRGRDVKQNLAVLPSSGELVYFVAAVVVLYDKRFSTQKHYLGHNEEITCLTVHPNGRFVATGQTAGKTPESGAHIRIWDGMSLSTYAVIGLGVFHQGIACLNFSEKESQLLNGLESISGDLLMAIDDSDRHVMSVWEWQTEKLVAKTTTTADPVVSGCFYPFDDTLLITYGKEHIHFWRMFWEKGRKVMRDKLSGNFEEDVPKYVTSVCFSPTGDVITGDSNGTILIWTRDNNSVFAVNENTSIQTKRAHRKSVAALCMLGDGTLFSGGGNEIKAWDSINNYSLVKERMLPDSAGNVRSLVPVNIGGLDGSIYVTTTRNKVLEGSLQLKFKFVIQSHVEELWALESHPLEQTFVSAGHDQTVIKWSAVSHAPVWKVDVEKPCTSISIDPKGRLVALGTTGGKVIVLNSYNGIQLMSLLTGQSQINSLSFSPDGKRLAVGTFDGSILIFFVQEEGHSFFKAQTASLKHNNMFIMHLDWSMDSKYLQAVLGDYDIIYWDVTNMQRIKAARSLRDVNWSTLNCPIGHSVIGPWQNLDRGEVINVVSRSQYRDFMVAGDSKGRIRLYKWPCSLPKAGFRNTKVYSSNVTCLTFSCDDGYVISSGGTDAAVMQFAVLDPNNLR